MSNTVRFKAKNGLDNNSNTIANVTDPSNAQDAATKNYVDTKVSSGTVTSITGTSNQVIASSSTGAVTLSLPQSINSGATPTFTGTNFTGIPNSGLTNSSVTIGSTGLALGATVTTFTGLTSVTSTGFTGALTGNASTASVSTNLSGGSLGTLPYQSSANTTAMLAVGTSGQILQCNGAAAPTWITASGISSGTATNIGGGAANSIPYQSGPGATTFLAQGTGVLQESAGAPVWSTAPTINGTNFSGIPNSALTNSTVILGSTSLALGSTTTTVAGLTSVTSTGFTGALTGNATTATTSTNIAAGTQGAIPYQTGAGATTMLSLGTSGYVLTSGGSAPGYVAQSTLSVGTATNATNINTTIASTNQTYPLILSTATTAGYQSHAFSTTVTYNPSTLVLVNSGAISGSTLASTVAVGTSPLTITSTTVVPNLNATRSSYADSVTVAATTANASYYIAMTPATSGNQVIDVVSGLSINPSTGALTVPGTITITSGTITNLNTPVNSSDAATKGYVDTASAGLTVHGSVETTSTSASNLSANTYTAGVAGQSPDAGAGVGAYLQATTNVVLGTIGGFASLAVGGRLLIKDQATTTQNGVYVVTSLGSASTPWKLTRSTDYNNSVYGSVAAGNLVYVSQGTNTGTQWVQNSLGSQSPYDVTKIGTDAITFTQFAGTNQYSAGTGLSLTSNTFANTGVLSITSNTGLSTNASATGNVTITNTGVTSNVAGTNISVSGATGAVTIAVTGTVPTATTATNLSGTTQYSVPYQSGSATTAYISPGTAGQVIISNGTTAAPSYTSSPTLNGSFFTSIPNTALTNTATTVNGVAITLGGSGTVTAAAGTLTGTALNATVVSSSLTSLGTIASLTATALTVNSAISSQGLSFSGAGRSITWADSNTQIYEDSTGQGPGDLVIRTGTSTNNYNFLFSNAGVLTVSSGIVSTSSTINGTSGTALSITGSVAAGQIGATISNTSTTGMAQLALNTGGTNGNKSIRSNGSNGNLEFVNSAYSSVIASLTDAGALTTTGYTGPGTGLTGTASSLSIGGNAATATTAGTVTTAAQTNITSLGTLTALTVASTSTTTSPLTLTASGQYGGTTYATFLTATNTVSGATNINKYFRLNPTGGFEIVNSAYNAVIFTVSDASAVSAGSFNATSTKKVKKAIKNLGKTYLTKFADLKPREYDRKDYVGHEFGFIAEEMDEIFPEIVGRDGEGKPSGIDYGKLTTILTAKVQEQQKLIDKLQTQMAHVMMLVKGVK